MPFAHFVIYQFDVLLKAVGFGFAKDKCYGAVAAEAVAQRTNVCTGSGLVETVFVVSRTGADDIFYSLALGLADVKVKGYSAVAAIYTAQILIICSRFRLVEVVLLIYLTLADGGVDNVVVRLLHGENQLMHLHRTVCCCNLLIVRTFFGQNLSCEIIAVTITDGVEHTAVHGLCDGKRNYTVAAEAVCKIDCISAGFAYFQSVVVIHFLGFKLIIVGEVLHLRQYTQLTMILPIALCLLDGVVPGECAVLGQGERLTAELIECL